MMSETDTFSNDALVAAIEARENTLSPEQKARLSAVAAVTETRGDVVSTVAGGELALSGQPKAVRGKPALSHEQMTELFTALGDRFTNTPEHYDTSAFRKHREGITFSEVRACLENDPTLARTVFAMHERGGEPDVWARAGKSFLFFEAAKETCPASWNCVYDKKSAGRLRAYRPGERFNGSVEEQRAEMGGAGVASEELWRKMQELGIFTTDTREWLESSDIIDTGFARRAFRGGGGLGVNRRDAGSCRPDRGWRAVAKGSET